MAGCCDPSGFRQVFNEREANRAVRSFRRRGLDSTAGPMVEALRIRGLEGTSVLEVGAGVGSAQVRLIEAGAASSVAYDLSPAHHKVGEGLLVEFGVADRVEWRIGDFATDTAAPRADVVFLNRVVCCYPDMEAMVDAAALRTNRLLAMAYPRDRWWVRVGIRALNGFLRIGRTTFRVFVHRVTEIERRVNSAGLSEVARGRTALWEWHVWERVAA
ncbi:MAG: methyltransferase domain-containing protein [Actinomycetota bacterium]|jgi:magnesium-protoporphyrin O-methyltransferase|nr:methyltransferase domain-containing protein [Actinomycetota bacterium]